LRHVFGRLAVADTNGNIRIHLMNVVVIELTEGFTIPELGALY
jgi:hypothetical protein